MFNKKNKEKDDSILTKKYFLLDNIIYNILKNRPLSFYKKYYKKYLNYSLFYIILTFFISSFATYNIHYKNQNHSIYMTNINGQTEEYERTEDRIETIKETIRYLNSKKGR
jgi:hypothetical protein